MSMTAPIPGFYRIFFTWIDPAACLLSALQHTLTQDTALSSYSATYTPPATVEHTQLLTTLGGFFTQLAILEAALFRYRPKDVLVWRVVQGSACVLEVFMIYGAVRALVVEGRVRPGSWRVDDWKLVVGNFSTLLVRGACALGVGMDGVAVKLD